MFSPPRTGLRSGAIGAFRKKKEAGDESLLSSGGKGRFIAKEAPGHSKIRYAKGAKHNSSFDALLCDGYKTKEEVMKV